MGLAAPAYHQLCCGREAAAAGLRAAVRGDRTAGRATQQPQQQWDVGCGGPLGSGVVGGVRWAPEA